MFGLCQKIQRVRRFQFDMRVRCGMNNGKSFRCEVLGWHTPTTIYVRGLSTTFESTCKRCGRLIMQDSQGNWFAYSKKGGADE